jgi:hypothetical protein
MHAAIRPYVTAGIALVGASAIAVTPIAATPPDITVADPAVQLAASPFDAYVTLFDRSRDNVQGLTSLALAPVPTLPFTVEELISQALDVNANVTSFQALVGGLSGQISSLNQLTQMFVQAASSELQAGKFADALDVLLYTALFGGSGVLGFALYPAALLGADVEELTPVLAGALLNAAVAPVLSGVSVAGHVTQDVVDALRSGNYQDIPGDLIAAPARLADGIVNGTELETSVFGPVAIPGILGDKTLTDAEGPGPISLAIQLVQIARGLLTPPATGASTLNDTQETARVRTFTLDLDHGVGKDVKPSTTASQAATDGNVLNADTVTNAGTDGPSTAKKHNRVRLETSNPGGSRTGATGLSSFRDGVRDGLAGLRDGVRDAVKTVTGRGDKADGATSADATGDAS